MGDTSHNAGAVRRIAVVGGGITGLSAAWALRREAASRGVAAAIELFESRMSVGGVLQTLHADGLVMEQGPDCFISTKPAALELCRELGLEDELIATRPEARQSFILHRGRLESIPKGFFLLAPTSLAALIRTPLLSWHGKLRASLDWVIPAERHPPGHDESLSSFVSRRFGEEVLQRIAQPMVGGIYTANPDQLSLAATFPQFLAMEAEHGSVIRALMGKQAGGGGHAAVQGAKEASGPRYGLFVSLRDGMSRLVEHLEACLTDVVFRRETRVLEVASSGSGYRLRSQNTGGVVEDEFDAIVIGCPARAASAMLGGCQDSQIERIRAELRAIEYASCAIVNLVFTRNQIRHPMDGAGFVVPLAEGRRILATSFSHAKWPNRAGEATALLRVFMGGAVQGELCNLPEREIAEIALDELSEILGIEGAPRSSHVKVWRNAMPQYAVGHRQRVERIRKAESALPGLALAGNAYEGVGIPDCIASSKAAATKVFNDMDQAQK